MKTNAKKYLYTLAIIGCVAVFAFSVTIKLVGGARWSSGLPLGGVDNWLYENGSLYTVAENGFTPGTSYFPGTILLLLAYRVLFGYGAETAMVITGGVIAIFMIWGFSIVASRDPKRQFWLAMIATFFFVVEFRSAKVYLLELHPDIPALVCFLWGVIFLNKYLKRHSKIYYCIMTLLFWWAGLFKQNAVFLYFGLAVFVLLSGRLSAKEKIYVIISEFIAGLATLATVMLIDGCWYNCVTVTASHPLLSINQYLYYLATTFFRDTAFIIIAILYFILLIKKKIAQESLIEQMWFAASIGWLSFCMYGAAIAGANQGNMEAAIIALMPFVLIITDKIFAHIVETIDINKAKAVFRRKKYIFISLAGLCSLLYVTSIVFLTYMSFYNIKEYNERIELQNEFSQWLSENYYGKNTAYDTMIYEVLNNAAINKTTDLYTVCTWATGGLVNDDDLFERSEEENWDVIVTTSMNGTETWPKTFSGFEKLDSSMYPDLTYYYRYAGGYSVDVYVRK